MGRGNFYMQGQAQSAIIHYETEFEDEDGEMQHDDTAFDFLLDMITSALEEAFPTLKRCDNRRGGDAILENAHCEVFIDDYCGNLSICLVPKDDDGKEGFHRQWCEKIKFLEALRDFDPYVRTSAWTSGRVFEPKQVAA
jgi:hypothetical protein